MEIFEELEKKTRCTEAWQGVLRHSPVTEGVMKQNRPTPPVGNFQIMTVIDPFLLDIL